MKSTQIKIGTLKGSYFEETKSIMFRNPTDIIKVKDKEYVKVSGSPLCYVEIYNFDKE